MTRNNMKRLVLSFAVAFLTGAGGHLADNLFDRSSAHSNHWQHKAPVVGGGFVLGGAAAAMAVRRRTAA